MMTTSRIRAAGMGALCGLALFTQPTYADPCGMVPPIYLDGHVPITRVGEQKTYVFYKDGVETFVIRPGFEGKVDEFGMLIPFPTVPEIRKVSDHIFPHIAAAIDPPEVVIDLQAGLYRREASSRSLSRAARSDGLAFHDFQEEARVIKQEAVGMYEVAVLEAGSSYALKRWMDDHGYKYPSGMDQACEDYVESGWCFVAVKTRVGPKQSVDPKPGLRTLEPQLPPGATFDGHVQAMGFRFRVNEPVLPMRLSTFNEGDLHNIVYVLTDHPARIRSVPARFVVRQIAGEQLFKNLTGPLPLRIVGGLAEKIPEAQRKDIKQRRDPVAHNGAARDLFASDLLSVATDRLSHPARADRKDTVADRRTIGTARPKCRQTQQRVSPEGTRADRFEIAGRTEDDDPFGRRRQLPPQGAGQ